VPFIAKDTPALLYAVVHIMPLRRRRSAIAPEIEALLTISLAKDRDRRFQTTAQLGRELCASPSAACSRRPISIARAALVPGVPVDRARAAT